MSKKEVQLVEISSELGAGTRGSSLGPKAIRLESLSRGSNFFKPRTSHVVVSDTNHIYEENSTPYAKSIQSILDLNLSTEALLVDVMQQNQFPVIVAGDHSNSIGVLSGIKKQNPGKRIGVIWIDAHADLHSPYTTPSGNIHGMPLAAALNEDNRTSGANILDKHSIELWNQLKELGGKEANILYEDLVFVGLRDFEQPEDQLIQNNEVKVYTVEQLRQVGIKKLAEAIIHQLKSCDHIHISFDVDSLDPSFSKGTGTPAPNGLYVEEAFELIKHLLQFESTGSIEIVEINPLLDSENKMAKMGLDFLETFCPIIEN